MDDPEGRRYSISATALLEVERGPAGGQGTSSTPLRLPLQPPAMGPAVPVSADTLSELAECVAAGVLAAAAATERRAPSRSRRCRPRLRQGRSRPSVGVGRRPGLRGDQVGADLGPGEGTCGRRSADLDSEVGDVAGSPDAERVGAAGRIGGNVLAQPRWMGDGPRPRSARKLARTTIQGVTTSAWQATTVPSASRTPVRRFIRRLEGHHGAVDDGCPGRRAPPPPPRSAARCGRST